MNSKRAWPIMASCALGALVAATLAQQASLAGGPMFRSAPAASFDPSVWLSVAAGWGLVLISRRRP